MKLTREQAERANKVLTGVYGEQYALADHVLDELAEALALPWDEPTVLEKWAATKDCLVTDTGISHALDEFLRRRNAALLPKPVDPRRQKVVDILARKWKGSESHLERYADEILAALDEAKV